MVLEIPVIEWRKLSHKQRRVLINKEKKIIVRRQLVEERKKEEQELYESPNYREKLQREEAEQQLQHEAWLERDRINHELFIKQKEKEDQKLKEREERERLIREEWEALERKEKEAEEKREQARREKETLLEEALSSIDQSLEKMSAEDNLMDTHVPWHNPIAPIDVTEIMKTISNKLLDDEKSEPPPPKEPEKVKYGTEKDKINCPFFIKTGACRYGDGCSRTHPIPDSSTTLIIRGMYSHVVLTQLQLDEHDQDVALELDEDDMLQDFKEFYEDVFPEFKKHGEIVQFKVSCNYEPHLRGNVYVQYSTEEECARALQQFNGRYYAGKQLTCHFCPVEKWKTAICGLNDLRRCPKGKHCNFLHVFRNPDGSFNWPEKDYEEESKKKERSRSPQERGRYRRPMRYSRSRSRSVERRRRNRRSHSGSPERRRRGYRYRSPRPRKRSRSPERRRMRRSRSPERRGHHHRRRESRSDSSDSSSEDDSDRRSLSNGHLSDDDDSHDDKRSRKRKGSKETSDAGTHRHKHSDKKKHKKHHHRSHKTHKHRHSPNGKDKKMEDEKKHD